MRGGARASSVRPPSGNAGEAPLVRSRPSDHPSHAQLDLVRTVAERHELRLPHGYTHDGVWVRRFLDCFAYDPETEIDIFRRVRNIAQWVREGRGLIEISRKAEIAIEDTAFVIEVLRASGWNLHETVEDPHSDLEDEAWSDLDEAFEG